MRRPGFLDRHEGARGIYHLAKGVLTRHQPVYVIYEVTDRCNLKCRMCSVWRRANRSEELALDQIEVLASRLRDMGVVVVSLSGGEPFLREDLPEIVKIFRRKGLVTRLMTNAVEVDEDRIRSVVEAGIHSVSISLNTLFPEEEAYICRSDNSLWEKVVANMLLFSRIMDRRGSLLVMSACVSSLNVDQIPLMEEFASFLGFRANFMPTELAPKRTPDLRFSDHAPELGLSTSDRRKFIEAMNTLLKRRRRGTILNSTRFLREMREFVLRNGYHSRICDAGSLYFTVDPAGGYSICHEFEPNDSILSPGFISRFESPKFQERWAKLRRSCPGCMHPCWMEISHLFRSASPMLEGALHFASNFRRRRNVELH
ncbi:MAG: radical SAM protein, partial [Candidatus Coatesbacteria bacterium]|nr:radical SAM protein [Candidatus Coatesbacteria bacterium]